MVEIFAKKNKHFDVSSIEGTQTNFASGHNLLPP